MAKNIITPHNLFFAKLYKNTARESLTRVSVVFAPACPIDKIRRRSAIRNVPNWTSVCSLWPTFRGPTIIGIIFCWVPIKIVKSRIIENFPFFKNKIVKKSGYWKPEDTESKRTKTNIKEIGLNIGNFGWR